MKLLALLLSLLPLAVVAGCAGSPAAADRVALPAAPALAGIAGTVREYGGAPAAGSYVYAYRNARGGLRGPADFEAQVGADGRYLLDLVEGSYHLVARRRPDGGDAGPPRAGDAWALPARNPVTVAPGTVVSVDFVLHSVAQPMLMREGTLTSGDTGFRGILADVNGRPVAGAFAMAFPEADFRRMPEATSTAVGEDGRFTLYLPRPGRWCLAARTRTRGQPVAGELYGVLGAGEGACRQLAAGELVDIGTLRLTPYRR